MTPRARFSLLTLLLITTDAATTTNTPTCENLSLTQKIENEGFHRKIHWLVERNTRPENNSSLIIRWEAIREIFVNPDEVNNMPQLSAYIDGKVDVEAVAHQALGHVVYVLLPTPKTGEKVMVELPFHLRYQRARISGGFAKVPINRPSVLTNSGRCQGNVVKVPHDFSDDHLKGAIWTNISYEVLFNEIELMVPVGDLDDYPLVSIVTLLLGCAGCIYTLSILSTTSI